MFVSPFAVCSQICHHFLAADLRTVPTCSIEIGDVADTWCFIGCDMSEMRMIAECVTNEVAGMKGRER